MHKKIYTVNKQSLKIREIFLNNSNKDLLNFLEVENYIFNNHSEAIKLQANLDVSVKIN